MRKIMICIALVIVTILLILIISPFVRILFDLQNPLRQSHEQIREEILELTPIGTSMDDVFRVVESNEKWKIDEYRNQNQGYLVPATVSTSEPIGEKSVKANIGVYSGEFRFNTDPINAFWFAIFTTGVNVYWAFDENSKLIEVFVHKETDVI